MRKLAFAFWSAPELLGVYVSLYNILSDDDEDIRDRGAVAASEFLSGIASENNVRSVSLMPPAASQKILQYLVNEHSNSTILWIEAAHQLTGTTSSFKLGPIKSCCSYEEPETSQEIFLHLVPARDMLQKAKQQDTALFIEEKPNLYVDPIKEAKNWAEVMLKLHSKGINSNVASEFRNWCTDGLKALIELTESQEDGPLGWVSKPDVFTLGMRIMLAAKVQIHGPLKDRKDQDGSIFLTLLLYFLKLGRERLLHGLWLQLIEEILKEIPRVS